MAFAEAEYLDRSDTGQLEDDDFNDEAADIAKAEYSIQTTSSQSFVETSDSNEPPISIVYGTCKAFDDKDYDIIVDQVNKDHKGSKRN